MRRTDHGPEQRHEVSKFGTTTPFSFPLQFLIPSLFSNPPACKFSVHSRCIKHVRGECGGEPLQKELTLDGVSATAKRSLSTLATASSFAAGIVAPGNSSSLSFSFSRLKQTLLLFPGSETALKVATKAGKAAFDTTSSAVTQADKERKIISEKRKSSKRN